jgi:hypothetical protein
MTFNPALAFENSPGTGPFGNEPVAVVWIHPNAANAYIGVGNFNLHHAADALRELAAGFDATAAEEGLVRTPAPAASDAEPGNCGATRVFGKGTEFEGKVNSVCEKPAGHDNRGPHRAAGMTGGIVQWRGDDREVEEAGKTS